MYYLIKIYAELREGGAASLAMYIKKKESEVRGRSGFLTL